MPSAPLVDSVLVPPAAAAIALISEPEVAITLPSLSPAPQICVSTRWPSTFSKISCVLLGVVDAIEADPQLTRRQRDALIDIYTSFVAATPPKGARATTTKKPSPAKKAKTTKTARTTTTTTKE